MYIKAQRVQTQSMVMTANIVQSIQMLQYSQTELDEFLAEQAERNPFIEVGPAKPSAATTTPFKKEWPVLSSVPGKQSNLEDYCAERPSLRTHLRNQLSLMQCDQQLRWIAEHIIESLDGDGYFRRKTAEMAETLGIDETAIDSALNMIKNCDPIGVGARDLRECMRLQLSERGWLTQAMDRLLERLDLLAKFEVTQLSRHCGISREDVSVLAARIRLMNPRPGSNFDSDPVIVAVPDLFVRRIEDGSFAIELNDSLAPRVLINQRYYAKVRASSLGGQEKSFVADCIHQAKWIARQLDQRASTILKVAAEIVAKQSAFFQLGPEHLRPLILKDVAESINVHPSTVCRAIANKFMLTHQGTFELRYFFANGISAADGGEEHSSQAIRFRIKEVIENESAPSVMSDDAIVAQLRREGIDIARRTVAKYREMLRIPSSSVRRRLKIAVEADGSDGMAFAKTW